MVTYFLGNLPSLILRNVNIVWKTEAMYLKEVYLAHNFIEHCIIIRK